MSKDILFVVTSHSSLGETGKSTGAFASEIVHPYMVLHEAGYKIDFASPKGGETPLDGLEEADEATNAFLNDPIFKKKLHSAKKLSQVDPMKYKAVFFAGGHGTMYDFPNNFDIQKIIGSIYSRDGIVAAVCHGPAAFVGVSLSDGENFIKAKALTGFTNEEEKAVGLEKVVPFLLQSKLEEQGAKFKDTDNFKENVVVDKRIITGQNPASAMQVGKKMLGMLEAKDER